MPKLTDHAVHRSDTAIMIATINRETGALEAEGKFNLDGTLIKGNNQDLSPNDVLFMVWRQRQDIKWNQTRCRSEWVKQNNQVPREDL
jgi:hypothetical protein